MRRAVLVLTSTLFLACAGIWTGSIIAVGGIAAPVIGREVLDPEPSAVIVHILRRSTGASVGLLAAMLALSLLDNGYRRRSADRLWGFLRTAFVVASLGLTLYLQVWLLPRMEHLRLAGDPAPFEAMRQTCEGIGQVLLLLGVASIGATSALNVGRRRRPKPEETTVGPVVP
jgi:hypothetical protein